MATGSALGRHIPHAAASCASPSRARARPPSRILDPHPCTRPSSARASVATDHAAPLRRARSDTAAPIHDNVVDPSPTRCAPAATPESTCRRSCRHSQLWRAASGAARRSYLHVAPHSEAPHDGRGHANGLLARLQYESFSKSQMLAGIVPLSELSERYLREGRTGRTHASMLARGAPSPCTPNAPRMGRGERWAAEERR